MNSFHKAWVLAAILVALLTSAFAPQAAAQTGSISGTIMDMSGKPWAEVTIRAVSDQGAKQEAKTDSGGKFSMPNLRAGIYDVFVVFPPPNDKQAEAYDTAGRNDDAAQAYRTPINARGDGRGYYNNLGNVLARAEKIDDARAAYTRSAKLDPPNAATAWRNFGISLYNANRLGDAVEPLQKSADLDPKNAQTWYLLGASLAYKMTTKKVGDKEVVQFEPETIEAYQKPDDLDPNGPWGKQAKQGLTDLKALGA